MMRLCLALAFAAALAAPAAAQSTVGDKVTVTVESAVDLEITVRDGKGEATSLLSLVRKEKFQQEVTEVANGRPQSAKIKCLSSTLTRGGTNMPLEELTTELAGKDFVSSSTEGVWAAKDPEGGAAPASGAHLGNWNQAWALLPQGELKAGAAWEVQAAALSALLSPTGLKESSGKLSCTAASVEGTTATITFTGQITGKSKEDAVIVLNVASGKLVFDLGKGRPVSLAVAGAISSSADVMDVYRRPNDNEEEKRKVGEISTRSRRLEASLSFE